MSAWKPQFPWGLNESNITHLITLLSSPGRLITGDLLLVGAEQILILDLASWQPGRGDCVSPSPKMVTKIVFLL